MQEQTLPLYADDRHRVPTEAQQLRDEGIALAEAAEDEIWKATADQAIRYLASLGRDFSSNDCRALGVPDPIRPRAWAARFLAAASEGLIEAVGATRSTKTSSRGAFITVWRPTAKAMDGAA
jgi:hypothetical protein